MRRSLANHILLSLLAIATVPVAMIGAFTWFGERREVVRSAELAADAEATRAAGRVEEMTRATRSAVRAVSSALSSGVVPKAATAPWLSAIGQANPVLASLRLVDTSGHVLAADERTGPANHAPVAWIGNDEFVGTRPGTSPQRARVLIWAPFRGRDGAVAGAAVASLNFAPVLAGAQGEHRDRRILMTDDQGRIIVGDSSLAGPPVGGWPGDTSAWRREAASAGFAAGFATTSTGWRVVVLRTESSVMRGHEWLPFSLVTSGGIALAVALLLALVLATRVTRPIEEVTVWLERLELKGDDPPPAPDDAPEEIDALVKHVEESALRLRHSYRQIETAGAEREVLNKQLQDLLEELERRVAERTADLEVALESAQQASRTKSRFLANMSHELRTPLNSVIGFAQVLRKNRAGVLEARDLAMLDRIQANGLNLLALINDILDMSKVEAGRMTLEVRSVDVAALVRATTEELEGQVLDKDVTLTFDGPAVCRFDTDEARLRQVVVNLVGNAVKFTERGSVRVTLNVSPAGLPAIEVRDTGIGIPKDRLRSIFTPFEQADSSTTRKYGGTGLGLAICRSLCEMLGATLTVESEVGRGSCFTIRFHDKRSTTAAEPRQAMALSGR